MSKKIYLTATFYLLIAIFLVGIFNSFPIVQQTHADATCDSRHMSLYQDINFGKQCQGFDNDVSNLSGTSCCNGGNWNDEASSMHITSPYGVFLYSNSNFNGTTTSNQGTNGNGTVWFFNSSVSDFTAYSGLNDKASSMRVVCGDGSATNYLGAPPCTYAPPSVSISANPSTVTSGQSSTISWSSTNATSCTASNAWSGAKATSGSQSVAPSSTSTYSLSCTGRGGTVSSSVTVTVNSPQPQPVTGQCSNPQTHYNCAVGSPSNQVSGSSSYTWTCNGSNGGGSASCSEQKAAQPINGQCSSPQTHYNCAVGSPSNQSSAGSSYTWTCNGSNGGGSQSCSEQKPPDSPPVNAQCGSRYNCAPGTAANQTEDSNSYRWTCNGSNGGSSIPCSEAKPPQSCSNGAQNPPSCNTCASNQAMCSGSCKVAAQGPCQNGAAVDACTGACPATPSCSNGATNPPSCTTYSNGACVNGGANPPSCTTCPSGQTGAPPNCTTPPPQSCSNGAQNPPSCTTNSSGACINNGTNPPTCTAPTCRPDQVGTPPNCQCPSGQSGNPCAYGLENPTGTESFSVLVGSLSSWFYIFSVPILSLMLLYGAFLIVTSRGEEEKYNQGKKIVKWGILGFILVLLSGAIAAIVRAVIG